MDTSSENAGVRPVVRLRDVRKVFGENEVLKGVNLDVGEGECVVIFGRSGSGKSTLLRCINFLEAPTSGSVEVDGILFEAGPHNRARRKVMREIRSRTGMVFQEFNLFPHLSVIENVIEAPLTVKGMPRQEAEELGMRFLERVGVADKRDEHPIRLSGGQKQRVAIARALAMQPKVMLFDEPTSALDPELIGEVLAVMKDQALGSRTTMLVITHEMGFAREVANRMAFMHEGTLIEEGPPAELVGGAKDPRTRRFAPAASWRRCSKAARPVRRAPRGPSAKPLPAMFFSRPTASEVLAENQGTCSSVSQARKRCGSLSG